jgi:hypothetical protein
MPGFGYRYVSLWQKTGKARARATFLGGVVVEVEGEMKHFYRLAPSAPEKCTGVETRWRRARSRDIAVIAELKLL